jgi:peptidoglycan/LPS O-acetylase OafA/YrhL
MNDYPFLDAVWTMFVFFGFVLWIWLLIAIFGDLFRRDDIGAGKKSAWIILVLVVPLLGAFFYMLVEGPGMGERSAKAARASQAEVDDYVRSVAGSGGAAAEIEKAKQLLDSGAITQAEFDAIKAKALAQPAS